MEKPRCSKCQKRMIAVGDEYKCLRCDAVDPLATEAVKWASGGLTKPK
jgi:tRNA(Ile2) C34 agmatinyltransferase TiaS